MIKRNLILSLFCLVLLIFSSCEQQDTEVISAFEVYCEMVANDAKPLALHYPMEPNEVDQYWEQFEQIAEKFNVSLYREDDFPESMLFPGEATQGKSVVLIYGGDRLTQYHQWKADLSKTEDNDSQSQLAMARRFGRLLGYSPQGINALLSKNSDFRTLASFGVTQQITHLYYEDLKEAIDFYELKLGLPQMDSVLFQIGADAFIALHQCNDVHPAGQVKSTAIALLTDQLPEWYEHVNSHEIPIKYTYKPKEGGPHDGFVAIDPGGYLLEFEEFKQHPENELFMAALDNVPKVKTSVNELYFFGSITWTYHNDLLKMQNFYQDDLGFTLVADQGWTKIYQTSPTGFIGLVDERRGMEDYADEKGVEIAWKLSERGFDAYATTHWQAFGYQDNQMMGPEKYIYHIRE